MAFKVPFSLQCNPSQCSPQFSFPPSLHGAHRPPFLPSTSAWDMQSLTWHRRKSDDFLYPAWAIERLKVKDVLHKCIAPQMFLSHQLGTRPQYILERGREFNNAITLKSNKACWSSAFSRNQTIYAITLSAAIVSTIAINTGNGLHQKPSLPFKKALRRYCPWRAAWQDLVQRGHAHYFIYSENYIAQSTPPRSKLWTLFTIQGIKLSFQRPFSSRLKVTLKITDIYESITAYRKGS